MCIMILNILKMEIKITDSINPVPVILNLGEEYVKCI